VGGEWLAERDWVLAAERLVEEDGVFYEVLAADRADSPEEAARANRALYAAEPGTPLTASVKLEMGPHLLREAPPAFFRKWEAQLAKLDGLLERIGRSRQPEAARRYAEIAEMRN